MTIKTFVFSLVGPDFYTGIQAHFFHVFTVFVCVCFSREKTATAKSFWGVADLALTPTLKEH